MLPESAVPGDPFRGVAHRRRDQRRSPDATITAHGRESRALQHPHVLRDRRQRHVEARREIADRALALREPRQDGAARRVRECGECRVERPWMVNHMVYYKRTETVVNRWTEPVVYDGEGADTTTTIRTSAPPDDRRHSSRSLAHYCATLHGAVSSVRPHLIRSMPRSSAYPVAGRAASGTRWMVSVSSGSAIVRDVRRTRPRSRFAS